MEDANNLNIDVKPSKSLGRLVFGTVSGVAVGAVGGYFFHRKFPRIGDALSEIIVGWQTDGLLSDQAKHMSGYIMGSIGATVGGVAGLLIADKTGGKSP